MPHPKPQTSRKRAFSNRLTPAEAERLYILIEEAAEVQQAATKILRHGYASHHPDGGADNRANLERELSHVGTAAEMMIKAGDVSRREIAEGAVEKTDSMRPYLHHQAATLLDRVRDQAEFWLADRRE